MVSPLLRRRAKALRRDMTDAERKLWRHLRAHRFADAHFRRQVPIGPYVVDFACHGAKLIVELDGGRYGTAEGVRWDARRTAWLEAEGFRVPRFWNTDVVTNPEGVLTLVANALAAVPPVPTLPRKGGGSASRRA
ncbi:MAG TPA: endonuclease domain-containing protein [Solirubrobacterales bacterium]|nr:endonuclease domain-containing protein [Solirubrobacterales bacterium]